jgi:pimeloyl-ACP methyl ester carboxylesterase
MRILKWILGIVLALILGVIAVFWQNDKNIESLKSKYASADSKFISMQGMQVHYREEGLNTDSIPVVLLHGTGASLHTWDGWVRDLAKHRKVIRIDLPAYGLTGPNPSRKYDMVFYADFMLEFLKKINVKKCVLGGNSLGGGIAWNVALKYPDLVSKLILVDAGGYKLKSKSVPIAFRAARWPIVKNLFRFVTPKAIVKSSLENVYNHDDRITEPLVDRYFDMALAPGNRQAFVDRMSDFNARSNEIFNNQSDKIKDISIPVLLIWGKHDELIPIEIAYKFQKDLPQDSLVVFDDLGHVPMEEDPSATIKPVLHFLGIGK